MFEPTPAQTQNVNSMSSTRPSDKEILSEQYWESKEENVKQSWTDSAKELGLATIGSVLLGNAILFIPSVAGVTVKLAGKIGIKCKKKVERVFPVNYSLAVLSIAVSLSEAKKRIIGVEDTEYGSIIEAELPADMRAFYGTMFFEIFDDGSSRTSVVGTSMIKGQWIDYGKGKKALTEIFDGAERFFHRTSMR